MKGFVEYIIGAIDDTELEIALDLAPSNLTREEQIDTELFNLLPDTASGDTREAIRELLELL